MNVSFFISILTEFLYLLKYTESLPEPKWKWGSNPKRTHGFNHRVGESYGCAQGQCIQSWKCPPQSISKSSRGSCTQWGHGPWVCCIIDYDKIHLRHHEDPHPHEDHHPDDIHPHEDHHHSHEEYHHHSHDDHHHPHEDHHPHGDYDSSYDDYHHDTSNNNWNKPKPTSNSRVRFPTYGNSWTTKRTTATWQKPTKSQPTRTTKRTTLTTRATWSGNGGRNPGWANPPTRVTSYPARVSTPITRSTIRSRDRTTTPLPRVNTYLCGIRQHRPRTNRRSRAYNPDDDVAYIGSSNSSIGRQIFQRIVGGEEVEPFTWPWVAAMYKVTSSRTNRFLCAGSLINENFVLTAAHCFTRDDIRSSSYVVMLGTHNAQDGVAQYLVSSVLQHPQYEQRLYYHDIALMRLQRSVVFNEYVMPVCLPSPDAPLLRDRDLEGKTVTVMGWGDESFGGKSSRVLKEATFNVVSRKACNASYIRVASNRFPRGITEDMLCAGDSNGGKDACQGDSGGPLTSIEKGRYTQVGIVSFGYQCGTKDFPGVYTKVAPYLSWIAENSHKARDDYDDYHHHDHDHDHHDYDYSA